MTVHFIGCGPGAEDLLTVRAVEILRRADLVLYAGSLVPEKTARRFATRARRFVDSVELTLDDIIECCLEEYRRHAKLRRERLEQIKAEPASSASAEPVEDEPVIARLHSGDPSLYGATEEQIRRLRQHGIACRIVPGVPAFAAAAAALDMELTRPRRAQTVVLTRAPVRTDEPIDLARFAQRGTTLALHLSINNLAAIVKTLAPIYGDHAPVIVAYRVSWPDELFIHATLSTIREKVKAAKITRTALIFVGEALNEDDENSLGQFHESRLYSPAHHHVLRSAKRAKKPENSCNASAQLLCSESTSA